MMRTFPIVVAAIAPFWVTAAHGQAAEPLVPSAQGGLMLAETFCKNCHVVEGEANNPVTAGIPSLRGIANRPGQTGAKIQNVLINPHAPMPDMKLSNQEIQNLLAYLETLRTDKTLPPLISPFEPTSKPKYPAPS